MRCSEISIGHLSTWLLPYGFSLVANCTSDEVLNFILDYIFYYSWTNITKTRSESIKIESLVNYLTFKFYNSGLILCLMILQSNIDLGYVLGHVSNHGRLLQTCCNSIFGALREVLVVVGFATPPTLQGCLGWLLEFNPTISFYCFGFIQILTLLLKHSKGSTLNFPRCRIYSSYFVILRIV